MRRPDDSAYAGQTHVLVIAPIVDAEVVATLPDMSQDRAVAGTIGEAVIRAVELGETQFTCAESATGGAA